MKETTFRQPISQWLLGIATVDVASSDTTTPRAEIAHIPTGEAHHMRESMRSIGEELRTRKRVRELDFAGDL